MEQWLRTAREHIDTERHTHIIPFPGDPVSRTHGHLDPDGDTEPESYTDWDGEPVTDANRDGEPVANANGNTCGHAFCKSDRCVLGGAKRSAVRDSHTASRRLLAAIRNPARFAVIEAFN
jgi:hypothetical protein